VGRLDDKGVNGMDLIANIKRMYKNGDGHVHVLAASLRGLDHLLYSFALGAELATVPGKVLEEWSKAGTPLPQKDFAYRSSGKRIEYSDIDLNQPWESFNIAHELTATGIQKFVADYRNTLKAGG